MSDSPDNFVELIEPQCRDNRQALAESLNSALDSAYEFVPQAVVTGRNSVQAMVRDEPGIAVMFQIGGRGIACLIPESLPLPKWYRKPNDSQDARLQTVVKEWSASLSPPEIEIEKHASVACGNLVQQLEACGLPDEVHGLELAIEGAVATQADAPLVFVWPLDSPQFQSVADWPAEEVVAGEGPAPPTSTPQISRRAGRMLGVPVELIVHIAGKKIDLRQLRGLSPGTLITFEKTCEDLLDVYVSNRLYCRGEAIKVGENFGVKINEVDARTVRKGKVQRI